MASINEIGNVYGYLTVIERVYPNTPDREARWRCKCKCGNEVIVTGKHLRSGNTKSCGCYQREWAAQSNMDRSEVLIGKKFGMLTVLEEAGFVTGCNGKRRRQYKCQCECGNICYVQHQYLTYGDTNSCGCLRSKGENQITKLLMENNINFKREYSFQDLTDKLPLRFDFAIFDNENNLKGLIEFQGSQHFQKNNGYYDENIVKHDKMKKEYCEKNNIKLIEIIYKRKQELTLEDLKLGEMFK